MRVLVTGGRSYAEATTLERCLREMHAERPFDLLIHGASYHRPDRPRWAPPIEVGADFFANRWGWANGIATAAFPAQWKTLGPKAGPLRNGRMIAVARPDVLVHFPGGNGTADCMRQAIASGIPTIDGTRGGGSQLGIFFPRWTEVQAANAASNRSLAHLDPLHPNGKCTCCGEGRCAWCVRTGDV